MIDQAKKNRLISHIKGLQSSGAGEILLTPEDYFDGYEAMHCTICANNWNSVSTSAFRARLADIAARPDVKGVFIRFYEYEDALQDASCWIGSDSVYLVTSATLDSVKEWFADFEASDVWEERVLAGFANLPRIPNDNRLVAVWWD
jgi:hypothetical protein